MKRDKRIIKFADKTLVTLRILKGYPTVKRNVYFQSGKGTYIIYKGKEYTVSFTKYNNTAYTLKKYK